MFAVVSPRSVTPTPTEVPGGSGPVTMVPGGCTRSCEVTEDSRLQVFGCSKMFQGFAISQVPPEFQGTIRYMVHQGSTASGLQGPRVSKFSVLRLQSSKVPGLEAP